MLLGSAVAIGLEQHFKGGASPLKTAEEYVEAYYKEGSDKSLKGTVALAKRGVELGMATRFEFQEVLAVEEFFGRIKPDLVAREYNGDLTVIDHKVKLNLDERWLDRELLGYDVSNQFHHYAWAVGQEFGEPVKRVYAHIIILAPNPRTVLHPVVMGREKVDFWLNGVGGDWAQMRMVDNGIEEPAPRFMSCITKYGPCEMYQGCHTFGGDESKFHALYDRR